MALTVGVDTYITLAEAEAYMATMVGFQKFAAQPTNIKEAYLGTAYRYIQAAGITLPQGVVPECVKVSQAEMALWDLTEGVSDAASDSDLLIKKAKVGSISVEYNEPAKAGARESMRGSTRFPPLVRRCLEQYGATFSNINAFQGLIVRA